MSVANLPAAESLAATHERADGSMREKPALTGMSVVVPMFNERDCVDKLLLSLAELDSALGDKFDFEFLLVDDGSTDETVSLLRRAATGRENVRIVEHGENRGIAAAIQTGIAAANHEIVASTDCDGSYDLRLLDEMSRRLAPGVDLVTASPYHEAGSVENVPAWRIAISRSASRMYGVACGGGLTCYTSCCRVYRRDAVIDIRLTNPGFVGVAELLWRVLQQGGVVVEHPARLRSRVAGHSKMRVLRASWGHLRLLAHIAAIRLKLRSMK